MQQATESRRWRSEGQKAADRAKVANLYLRGEAVHSIAAIMGVKPATVLHDLRAIRNAWRKEAVYDFSLARQQELARIDMVEAEAWKAWEMSKAPLETTNTRQRRRDLAVPTNSSDPTRLPVDSISEANRRTVQRDPNPSFLERVAWCVEMRCKILGLIAPQELRHSGSVTTIKEIHYEPSASSGSGRLVILGGSSPALPTPTPADLEGPDGSYDAPDLSGESSYEEEDTEPEEDEG